MAALKAKVVLRLERGDGDRRVFWEITREKATITTRFGRYLSAGRKVVKAHETPATAARAFDRAVEEKRREGYTEPHVRAEVGAASRKGVVARNHELEALVDEAPSDPERYLVYADWLQQQGDPRGELIVIQHRLATSSDRREISLLERDHAALLAKFEDELLGPLAKYVFLRSSVRSYRTFSWRCGFIRAARLSRLHYRVPGEAVSTVLRELLQHPSGRFLERLVIGGYTVSAAADLFDDLGELAPPSFASLVIGDGGHVPVSLDALWPALPRLRSLELTGQVHEVGAARAEHLRVLRVGWAGHAILRSIASARFPALDALHVTLPERDSGPLVAEILRSDAAPALDRLTVRRWVANVYSESSYVLVPQDALAIDVARAAAERRLARLDLELPLGDEGAGKLLSAAGELRAIGEIHVPAEGVSSALRKSVSTALPRLSWTASPEEEELDLEEIDERPATWQLSHGRGGTHEPNGPDEDTEKPEMAEKPEKALAPLSSRAEPR